MVGTGVFAVWQGALERSGRWLVAAVVLAAVVAALNATSTARLAARHPEAGGVYTYGRIYLGRPVGVVAGVVFIVGKTASASAAALTIGLYVSPQRATQVALGAIAIALIVNIRGIVRSTRVAAVMVIVVGIALGTFVISSGLTLATRSVESSASAPGAEPMGILAAAGLVFVAFAGYARITVLGEEVKNPRHTIPRAIAVSFAIVMFAYVLVAVVVVSADRAGVAIGPAALNDIARALAPSWVVTMVVVGSVLAAGAVLWSLIAGVGRTVFAMASRGDAPRFFAAAGRRSRIPIRAEVAAALATTVLVIAGGLTLALAVSATMILTYYSIAHLSALRLAGVGGSASLAGRVAAVLGLVGCVGLVAGLLSWA
jgi:APA family basic amino acid/polyamine antiporter